MGIPTTIAMTKTQFGTVSSNASATIQQATINRRLVRSGHVPKINAHTKRNVVNHFEVDKEIIHCGGCLLGVRLVLSTMSAKDEWGTTISWMIV